MVINHSLTELLHVRIGCLAGCQLSEIHLGHSACRRLLREGLIGGSESAGGFRPRASGRRWLRFGSFRLRGLRFGWRRGTLGSTECRHSEGARQSGGKNVTRHIDPPELPPSASQLPVSRFQFLASRFPLPAASFTLAARAVGTTTETGAGSWKLITVSTPPQRALAASVGRQACARSPRASIHLARAGSTRGRETPMSARRRLWR